MQRLHHSCWQLWSTGVSCLWNKLFCFWIIPYACPADTLQKMSKNQTNTFLSLSVSGCLRLHQTWRIPFAILEYSIDRLDQDLFARQLTCTLLLIQGRLERILVCQPKYIWILRPFIHQHLLICFVKWLGTGREFDLTTDECVFSTNDTVLRTTFFCAVGASNGMLLTIALVSDLAGGEGVVQCSLLSLVLRGFAAPSWELRLSSSASPRALRLVYSGNSCQCQNHGSTLKRKNLFRLPYHHHRRHWPIHFRQK